LGLSEKNDVGNQDHTDKALVFSASFDPPEAATPGDYGQRLASLIAHEAGRLLGVASPAAPSDDPLASVAWNVYTHLETARDIRRDLIDDGKVTILGQNYTVNPLIVEAIRDFPGFYFAGANGPDTFPDFVYGNAVVHPVDSGTWAIRVLDMAWAAQKDD